MLSDRRSMSPMSPLSILAVACAFAAAAQGFDVKEIKVGGQHPLYGLAQHGLGKVAEESEIDGQIVGGRDAYTSEFPHQASMQVVMPGFLWFEAEAQHICGGSLIAANWVLTAAHCPYGVPSTAKRVEVVLGINSLSGSSSGQRIVVSKMLVNSKYDPNWNYGVGPYDIALLKLSSNAKLSNSVKLAYLPATGAVPSGNAVVSGWGSTSKNGDRPVYPDKLKTATLPIVDFATCYRFVSSMSSGVNPLLESSNLCTGPLDKNGDSSCSGDSGGPLIQTEGGNAVVVGVVSWGLKHCASIPYPSVFTLTSGFIDWIAAQQKAYP